VAEAELHPTVMRALQKDNPDKITKVDPADVAKTFSEFDSDGGGFIDFQEFRGVAILVQLQRACSALSLTFEPSALMNHLKIAPQIHLPFDQASKFGVFMNAYRDLQYLSEFNAANSGSTEGTSFSSYLRKLNETRKYYSKPKFLAFQALYWAVTAVIIYERYEFYAQKVELITIAPRVLVSRVTAQLIGYNMGLAVITKCHLFLTYLFSTPLKPFLPLEFADDIHWQTGIMSGICATFHVVGHGENFKDVSRSVFFVRPKQAEVPKVKVVTQYVIAGRGMTNIVTDCWQGYDVIAGRGMTDMVPKVKVVTQ
jgi:hypothetical protein